MDSVDRISDMPDDILAHILSFLSIKEAVHTCVLSKKWRNIWCYMPVLEFDFKRFYQDQTAASYGEVLQRCEVKFVPFVRGVLQNQEARLDKFKLQWYMPCTFDTTKSVAEVILDGIKFKPRVFSVNFCRCYIQDFDLYPIFTCASLEDVTLELMGDFIAPNSVNLPNLKRLKISLERIDDDIIDKIFLGCPSIEEMSLFESHLCTSRISSNRLKKLVVDNCYIDEERWLDISTPSLLHLEIAYKSGLHSISSENLTSLTNACIDLQLPRGSKQATADDLIVLNCLSNATSLALRIQESKESVVKINEKIKGDNSNHPSFPKLKYLRVEWCMDYFGFDLLAFFLQHSPELQKLTIELHDYIKNVTKKSSDLEEPKDVFLQRDHLETVMIVRSKLEESKKIADRLVNSFNAHVNTIGEIITKIEFSILRL
ncbi:F-box/RNI-like superfamily protein [Rhynchospora pubera]|uniref:F-box/RNI-like superfamily protein n=1 Tax=Rhynchospora pubera TaxID=906938 RepID=A0AAV8ERB4_9POAL|nr:F-box/RNI-like superfamily protein [Rhynchospora pubera]